jgi:hypothetical protein
LISWGGRIGVIGSSARAVLKGTIAASAATSGLFFMPDLLVGGETGARIREAQASAG